MEVTKVKVQGFCKGVIYAIYKINKVLKDTNIKKPIYMLGSLVHNKHIVNAFKNKGIIILEGKKRIDLLDEINEGSVIFTAHGVSDAVYEKARSKGLNIIDATCKDVIRVHDIVKDKTNNENTVLFLGKKGHPETEGVLESNKSVILIEENFNINQLPEINGNIILTNQTTMSFLDVLKAYDQLKIKYPNLELVEEVCNATRVRQNSVIEFAKNSDLVIVVGDKSSNNTRMLKEVSTKYGNAKSISVETIEDLNSYDLSMYQKVAITSGASTPPAIVNEIIEALRNYDPLIKYQSHLTDDDYLKF